MLFHVALAHVVPFTVGAARAAGVFVRVEDEGAVGGINGSPVPWLPKTAITFKDRSPLLSVNAPEAVASPIRVRSCNGSRCSSRIWWLPVVSSFHGCTSGESAAVNQGGFRQLRVRQPGTITERILPYGCHLLREPKPSFSVVSFLE